MRPSRHRWTILALTVALTLVVGACAAAPEDPLGDPGGGDQPADADGTDDGTQDDGARNDGDVAAGGTTMRVYTVPEALGADDEGSIHVSGMLIDDGSGWRLCEMALESYPPRCGGESVTVEGIDAAGYPLEESGDVRWQSDATIVGELDGDTLVITGSPAGS